MGHGIVLKGIVKYYGRGKNIPHTFGYTALSNPYIKTVMELLIALLSNNKLSCPLAGGLIGEWSGTHMSTNQRESSSLLLPT
jgi:hypothetical protein